MIKATELRIGNLVNTPYGNGYITDFYLHNNQRWASTDKARQCFLSDLEPIDINEWLMKPEWLEIYQFEKLDDHTFQFYTRESYYTVFIERIKHVHLFQNWFYFNTGIELK